MAKPTTTERGGWLNRGILGVGAASFFSDSGHEMATSLLPSFLGSTLHAGPAALGAIEGVSDALTGLSKLAGGPLSNEPSRRARVASGGYLLTALATAAIGLATAVWQVAVLRGLAWASRGVRSPARDTLLASIAPRTAYGRAAGVERAGDNAGAVLGPLLAAALVGLLGVRTAIVLSFIPSIFAVAAIALAARQARRALQAPAARRTLSFNLGELARTGAAKALLPVSCFELGNLATTLLILRATGLIEGGGLAPAAAVSLAIVLYSLHNAVAALAALAGGHLVDRISARSVFAAGAAAYVLAYALFALGPAGWAAPLVAFILAGVGIGLAETAETASVAIALPDRLRGNGYGILGLVQSAGDLGATLVAGVLWAALGPTTAFAYAAAWMLASVLLAPALRPGRP
ncbi:MFS transporter [Sinomonas sp.]|jgi:MFS family permease|uniref:MFS transporter n=1 Tax=Sinomonas sp. TaxID=1914986 RepID=UPI002FE2BF10